MTTEPAPHQQNTLDPQLLAILCCPETKQEVTLLEKAGLDILNQKIGAGELHNVGGSAVKDKLEAGLLRADHLVVYPIRDAIPIMLIDEGIVVKGIF